MRKRETEREILMKLSHDMHNRSWWDGEQNVVLYHWIDVRLQPQGKVFAL